MYTIILSSILIVKQWQKIDRANKLTFITYYLKKVPDPVSNQGELIDKLAEYLTQETSQFYPDIDWQYYSNEHAPSDSPKGAVFLPNYTLMSDNGFINYDYVPKEYNFIIRLLISNYNQPDLIKSLLNWSGHLTDIVLRKLHKEGYQDYFQKIYIDKPVTISPSINQDRGGTGAVQISLTWEDQGSVAGVQTAAFL